MKREDFIKKFLLDNDETGRFIVKSKKTGKTYFVEAIDGDERTPGEITTRQPRPLKPVITGSTRAV